MRKEKMKVYHGLPKSITDDYTIFYADFDGNTNPSVGLVTTLGDRQYKPSPYGYGLSSNSSITLDLKEAPLEVCTIDLYCKYKDRVPGLYIERSSVSDRVLHFYHSASNDKLFVRFYNGETTLGGYYLSDVIGANGGELYIRLVVSKTTISLYLNGKLCSTVNHSQSIDMSNMCKIKLNPSEVVSDVHISNIDRGNYFPNLPQDFIEGKAVIKPRMGQQQIKGDPMYSQVTLDKVKIGSNVNEPQITCSRTDGEWANADTIKVKGLNREIISGVIDTDTALAKIVSYTPNTRKVIVDDVSKLSVGDTVQFFNSSFDLSNSVRTINEINGNELTLQSEITVTGAMYLVETTASFSSPIVKTTDGTTVVGTWSGLGTNEATFTLGENASISGKDLYITYALTIPSGNSDFPQLPHTVERAYDENGLEMKSVNEIVIVDDFRGKISGSIKRCPHISKITHSSSLLLPNSNWTRELTDDEYSIINSLDDRTMSLFNSTSNNIPQQLFSFNIIEMVERKLGCKIPSNNKVQWLKDNLDNYCKCTVYGYGSSHLGNVYKLSSWYPRTNEWTNDTYGATHYQNKVDKITYTSIGFTDRINDDGYSHFLVYTNASDDSTASTLYTDYVSLEIKLKVDSTFTTLYCENRRAREDECNPVLIQKETKTVKRYLPSKEPFVTECTFYRPKLISKPLYETKNSMLSFDTTAMLTTMGTGEYGLNSKEKDYASCLAKLGFEEQPYLFNSEVITRIVTSSKLSVAKYWIDTTDYPGAGFKHIPTTLMDMTTGYMLKPFLINEDGVIKLQILGRRYVNGKFMVTKEYVYELPNKPLIK